jgi:hypothetical protein
MRRVIVLVLIRITSSTLTFRRAWATKRWRRLRLFDPRYLQWWVYAITANHPKGLWSFTVDVLSLTEFSRFYGALDTSHGGYGDIGTALDRAFKTTSRTPDIVLSGHVHNYQRFTRRMDDKQIPYVIAGAGGYADSERAMHRVAKDPSTGKKIKAPFQTSLPDLTLAAYNDTQPGFLRLKVTKTTITCEYYIIDFQDTPKGVSDHFTIPLGSSAKQVPRSHHSSQS